MQFNKQTMKKIIALFISSVFLTSNMLFAQTTTPATATVYNTDTIQAKANELCARYSGSNEVYIAPTVGSGSTVPTSLPTLEAILKSIERYVALTGNELRQQNTLKFCEEYQNLARANAKLSQDAKDKLKDLADNCYADQKCLAKRVYEADVQRELDKIKDLKIGSREIAKLILDISKKKDEDTTDYEFVEYCNQERDKGRNPVECITAPTTESIILQKYYEAKNRIENRQEQLNAEFIRGNGVIANRPCIQTKSGNDPTQVKFYDPDCISWKSDPSLVNQESLRQIVALPYTQAFSPSAVLGNDGVVGNINKRVQSGNLIDPNISSNFGSTGGGGTVGPVGTGTGDLAGVEANYKKLIANVLVITNLYDATRMVYASSTSLCSVLPVQTRNQAISQIDAARKTYADYSASMTRAWEAALKTPRESHTTLIVQINFDLKDKVNQAQINKVYDAVKARIQICADAGAKAT
jgi:hypothetical protein